MWADLLGATVLTTLGCWAFWPQLCRLLHI